MGERGISDNLYGWPYCSAAISTTPAAATTSCRRKTASRPGSDAGADDYHFWSHHVNSAHFLWADGSAKSLTYDMDQKVFQALSTRAGGEIAEQ